MKDANFGRQGFGPLGKFATSLVPHPSRG